MAAAGQRTVRALTPDIVPISTVPPVSTGDAKRLTAPIGSAGA